MLELVVLLVPVSRSVIHGLIQFDQHAITTFRVNKNDFAIVRAFGGRITQKLIALGFEPFNIGFDVVTAKTQVMNAAAFFIKVFLHWPFTIQWVNQFNTAFFYGQESSAGLGLRNIFCCFQWKPKVFGKALDSLVQVRNRNRNMV